VSIWKLNESDPGIENQVRPTRVDRLLSWLEDINRANVDAGRTDANTFRFILNLRGEVDNKTYSLLKKAHEESIIATGELIEVLSRVQRELERKVGI
jgi:hypothetical protein